MIRIITHARSFLVLLDLRRTMIRNNLLQLASNQRAVTKGSLDYLYLTVQCNVLRSIEKEPRVIRWYIGNDSFYTYIMHGSLP